MKVNVIVVAGTCKHQKFSQLNFTRIIYVHMRVRKTKFTCNDFSLGLQNFRGRVRFSEEDLVLSFTVDVLCSALVRAIVAAINGNDLQHYNFL